MNTQHKLLSSCPVSCFADEIAESLDRQIEVLSRLGISYVELRSADGINVSDFTMNFAKEVKKKLDQANIRILDKMAKKIGVDRDKLPANMMEYGNTSAASIPILLSECVENGMIRLDGSQTILLSGFGGGLTWGTLILTI